MLDTFFDLVVALVCPVGLCAAAWMVAAKSLAEADEISNVVKALTLADGAESGASQEEKISSPRAFRRDLNRRNISISRGIRTRAARSTPRGYRRKRER